MEPEPKQSTTAEEVVLFGVLKDLTDRAAFGHEKYGTFLKTYNGRKAMQDLYEELLDACMYVKQHLMEIENEGRN